MCLYLTVCFIVTLTTALRADQTIYDDALVNGWENWGWANTLNYGSTTTVHSGTKSIAVAGTAWQAIYMHHAPFNSTPYVNLTFWINGGSTGGQLLRVQALLNGAAPTNYFDIPALPANTWTKYTIPLATLGATNKSNLDGFWIQDRSNASFTAYYLDDIALESSNIPVGPTIFTIDVAKDRHTIDPRIYGVAFASSNDLAELNVPLNRSGGNATTRYNWEQNSFQTGFDWFFQSLPYSSAVPGDEADKFVADSRNGGAEPMITIPTMGWVADITTNRVKRWSFSVAKYGAQTETEATRTGYAPWASPDSGNGISSANGQPITTNDPLDANKTVTSNFQKPWVQHLTNRWGTASGGGVRYYILDNEPSIWMSTHRDVFRTGATMQQILDRIVDYGTLIKTIDPGAIISAPEEWGWSGYLFSGYDQQYSGTNGYTVFPDKAAHGNWDYLPWLLDQLRRTNTATGQRLLDIFTVHYYPQGGEFSSDVSTDMQLRRNRSTRSLWDTNYVDESWIGASVHLVPRLKWWVQTNYPGTKVGVTEYSWGAEEHINGATAQADILGIFGRENLDIANRWVSPANTTPTFKAFKMYRNYDGNKSTFGNISVSATAPDPDELSIFAAIRTNDSALTIMTINKTFSAKTNVTLQFTNALLTSTGTVWQLNASNAIARLPDITNVSSQFTYSFPAQSITLFVIPHRSPARPRLDVGGVVTNQFVFSLVGDPGIPYVVQTSSNLLDWTSISTNVLSTNYTNIFVPKTAAGRYYRAVWNGQ